MGEIKYSQRLKMHRLKKSKLSYFQSPEGRKKFRSLIIFGVVVIAMGGGFYLYAAKVNRSTYQKFIQAQNLYLQANREEKEKVEKLKKAAQLFQEVIAQKLWWGSKEEALFYLASCFYQLRDYRKSIQVMEEFDQRFPRSYFSPWVKLRLAWVYEEIGEHQRAIKLYEEIGRKYAQSSVAPEALLGQARCQEYLGNEKEAIEIYKILLSRYPLSTQAALGEARLQKLALR